MSYKEHLINALNHLALSLEKASENPAIQAAMLKSTAKNNFFTPYFMQRAMSNLAMLIQKQNLEKALRDYKISDSCTDKVLAIVMAGNIPLVGFHDYLCGLLAGYRLQIKLSSQDPYLLPALHAELCTYFPEIKERLVFTDGMCKDFDAIIATGSTNTSRYFEYYFSAYPHIIRKHRTSVAVLDGTETEAQLDGLVEDCLLYFGLGCRSVGKLYLPENYDFTKIEKRLELYPHLAAQNAYRNNYDYQRALLLINKVVHKDLDGVLLCENKELFSPVSVLFYEYYTDKNALLTHLHKHNEQLQCIVPQQVAFGCAQIPDFKDFADGVDTLKFLLKHRT